MRKEFLKLIAITILFSAIEQAAYAQPLIPDTDLPSQEKLDRQAAQVDLVLPSVAEVFLKSAGGESTSESQSGRLINIEEERIQLENAGVTKDINIADVEQIVFRGYAVLNSRKIAIRGNGNGDSKSVVERLRNFQIISQDEGNARLELTSAPDASEFTQDYYYIVREMSFDSPETINIKYKVQP